MTHLLAIARRGVAARYVPTSTHEEALARLDFLVAESRRLGLVVGPDGSGKSLVLQVAAHDWRKANHGVALVSARPAPLELLLAEIAAQWQNAVRGEPTLPLAWQAIADALAVHRMERRASVLVIDDAGDAPPAALEAIERLVQLGDAVQERLTVILAVEPHRTAVLGRGLLERVELRIDVAPLDLAETRDYLRAQFDDPAAPPALDMEATERLHALSAGLPRRIDQLARLVRLAAAGEGRDTIDPPTLDAVYRELSALPLADKPAAAKK